MGAAPTREPLRSDAHERLILLGTAGASNPKSTRAGFSNAVVVGDVAYLVDCGEGVHRQAWRSGISMHPDRRPRDGSTVRSIFFTHLHSDHVIDFIVQERKRAGLSVFTAQHWHHQYEAGFPVRKGHFPIGCTELEPTVKKENSGELMS